MCGFVNMDPSDSMDEDDVGQEEMEYADPTSSGKSDSEMDDGDKQTSKVYLPGKSLEEGETLICDESAYRMYHQAQTGNSAVLA